MHGCRLLGKLLPSQAKSEVNKCGAAAVGELDWTAAVPCGAHLNSVNPEPLLLRALAHTEPRAAASRRRAKEKAVLARPQPTSTAA